LKISTAKSELWKRRIEDKPKEGFPSILGNPATAAGFPLSHNSGCCHLILEKSKVALNSVMSAPIKMEQDGFLLH
jgi:hypothetical protein